MHNLYSINDVARKLGISISTIRKYEQDYGLDIMRNESNNRVYAGDDIEIFKKIVQLKEEGANIHLIRKILAKEGIIERMPDVLDKIPLHTDSIEEFKQGLITQISEIVLAKDKSIKEDFERMLDDKLQEQENKIREQIAAENQKLIGYIESKREEKRGFLNRLFSR